MPVYLLRHTESEFNVDPTSSVRDCGLTMTGRIAAGTLIQWPASVDVIVCSPLRRCRETLAEAPIPVLSGSSWLWFWEELREVRRDPCDYLEGEEMVPESEEAVLERVRVVREWLALQPKQTSVLLVGHADFFWYLTSWIAAEGERFGVWLENGQLVQMDGGEDADVATSVQAVGVRQTGHLSSDAASGPQTCPQSGTKTIG